MLFLRKCTTAASRSTFIYAVAQFCSACCSACRMPARAASTPNSAWRTEFVVFSPSNKGCVTEKVAFFGVPEYLSFI